MSRGAMLCAFCCAFALSALRPLPARAERLSPTPVQRSAHKEKIAGIALSFIGLAISLTGGIFAIVNRGFDRDTPEQRVRFGLSVGLAGAAAPIVTSGVTLWAHGAVRERREQARIQLALDGLHGVF